MNPRSSLFVLAIGFGILIVLIGALGYGALRRADSIHQEMRLAQDSYLKAEESRRGIVQDIFLADILVRDYLLDTSPEAPSRRNETIAIRKSVQRELEDLSMTTASASSPALERLGSEVERYWESLDPVFQWTAEEKKQKSWVFFARNVLPRRDAVINLARELARLNNETLGREGKRLQDSQRRLHDFLFRMMTVILGIGICVALLTTHRVIMLQRTREAQRQQLEETQNNLRRLSRRLVEAQEVERRALSRELHDEVGQMMTAVGIELGNLESLRGGPVEAFRARIEDAKRLNADAMRALRDIAMGLRPSMLDDLGLQAALEWQGREFSRRTGVTAVVDVDGELDDLPDEQRTCIYRVVQEALTNCARHAQARHVNVAARSEGGDILVVIEDDGVGFETASAGRGGLGLLGIQERVQALAGRLNIASSPKSGTRIQVQIPYGAAA
ncbi:MAG TPA: ATP-binding protein [Terriglobia bacterium]|nr:ATP-binding protein [Terriglobia bacterium]